MNIVHTITNAVEPSLNAMGYTIVLVRMMEGSRRRTLSIMAERRDGQPMGFDDCTEISRIVSALLEVEDPITGAYDLEVCSPGIDRPLTRPEDYQRFAGQEAKIETVLPIHGRKRFRGVIEGIDTDMITLTMPEGQAVIPFHSIRIAKLAATEPAPPKTRPKGKKNRTHE